MKHLVADYAASRDMLIDNIRIYNDDKSPELGMDVGGVPISIFEEQIDISTPYNSRSLELRDFKSDKEMLDSLFMYIEQFRINPDMTSHPFIRFICWIKSLWRG